MDADIRASLALAVAQLIRSPLGLFSPEYHRAVERLQATDPPLTALEVLQAVREYLHRNS